MSAKSIVTVRRSPRIRWSARAWLIFISVSGGT
jgi:hypothetical protein